MTDLFRRIDLSELPIIEVYQLGNPNMTERVDHNHGLLNQEVQRDSRGTLFHNDPFEHLFHPIIESSSQWSHIEEPENSAKIRRLPKFHRIFRIIQGRKIRVGDKGLEFPIHLEVLIRYLRERFHIESLRRSGEDNEPRTGIQPTTE